MRLKIMTRNRQRRKRVIVALEGSKLSTDEQGTAPLRWAMREVIGRRDDVLVLTIINPVYCMESANVTSFCCLGGDQHKSPPHIGEKYIQFIHAQINQRRKQYLEILRPYYDRSKSSGVKFQVKVAVGTQPVAIVFEEAIGFKTAWIIMDRCFGGKKNLHDDYHMALVNDKEEAEEHNHLCPRDELRQAKTDGGKHKKRTPCSLRGEAQIPEGPFTTSPRSVKESIAQEEPHLRDSLPNIKGESRPFSPSFLVNISETENEENETNLHSLGKESESEANIEQLKEEPGNEAGNGLTLMEQPTGATDNSVMARTSTSVPTYYSEKHGQKEILEGGKGSSGYKRERTRTRTAFYDDIAFGRFSRAMMVLRKPIELSWEEITDVTNGFHPDSCISKHNEYELYDGFLKDPHFPVLVKKLKGDSTGVVETEKRVTCSLFHQNIMGLSAYHDGANATALVHAVADKGTLDQYLYGVSEEQAGLKFKTRLKIAIEIGRCLRYLHEECPGGPVVHNNLQPHNIFLAHDYQPLVSGFGQATWAQLERRITDHSNRFASSSLSSDSTRHFYKDVLEYGSMELVKADVFSYGVLLLRLFCQRVLPKDDKHLVELARPFLRIGAFHELLDQDMEDLDMYGIYRVMFAAIKCTNAKHSSRPTMSQVVSILMGENSCVVESSPSSDGSAQGGAE